MNESLITKYRPDDFDSVFGHDSLAESLKFVIKKGAAQSFLFAGPSGVGKTTLARIVAEKVGCAPDTITELDAATHTGIDAMRALTEMAEFRPLGGSSVRGIIIDECHALSAAAWKSLLKSVEEPPEGMYWFFCTTELGKVPATIKTRCAVYNLELVPYDDLYDLVVVVAEQEEQELTESMVNLIVSAAYGSPRQALMNLAMCLGAKTDKEVKQRLNTVSEDEEQVIDICRKMIRGELTWAAVQKFMDTMQGKDVESVRMVIVSYVSKVLSSEKNTKKVPKYLAILENFEEPFYKSPGVYQLWLAFGRLLF
jgi:DNA polymerase-3 subunit gamma/tau